MPTAVRIIAVVSVVFAAGACADESRSEKEIIFRGASDASAAVAVTEDLVVIADDESNVLRIYKTGGGMPVYSYDLSEFLKVEKEHPEADIEGGTRVGSRIYWITSHGRNTDGKIRPNRYRFFAVALEIRDTNVTISPVGKSFTGLVEAMLNSENLRGFGLDKATQLDEKLSKKERGNLAPKENGLNIECLSASADGNMLYVGFRNPRPVNITTGRICALIVKLENAADVVEKGGQPVFGKPLLWDLGGLGIRSMEYSPLHKTYFVIAGSPDETARFAFYRWSGDANTPPQLLKDLHLGSFGPEAVVPFTASSKILLISDDGALPIKIGSSTECLSEKLNINGTCPNKFLLDPGRKTFRGIWFDAKTDEH
jgi:hypothetical protein